MCSISDPRRIGDPRRIIDPRRIFRILVLLFMLLHHGKPLKGQADYETERGELRLMWYNVENLFHPSDDSLPGDDEFTPGGVRSWTQTRYRQKLTCLARVIVAAGQWQPPELVGLCEVENSRVLEDLVSHPLLAPYAYSYLHHEGPDHRGMDVACLFRSAYFTPLDWQYIDPTEKEGFDQTREMLYLSGVWGPRDTMEVVLVHFISRYRGSGQTAEYRRQQANRLAAFIDSLACGWPDRLVLAAGDFNDERESWSLEPLSGLWMLPADAASSYKYRGVWSAIDFFIVGGGHKNYRIRSAIFKHPRLLQADLSYGGLKPFRTYDGYRYSGGYSDHLPVVLDISRFPFFRAVSPGLLSAQSELLPQGEHFLVGGFVFVGDLSVKDGLLDGIFDDPHRR